MIVNIRLDLSDVELRAIKRRLYGMPERGKPKPATRADVIRFVLEHVETLGIRDVSDVNPQPLPVRPNTPATEDIAERVRHYGVDPAEFNNDPHRMLSYLRCREQGHPPGRAPR